MRQERRPLNLYKCATLKRPKRHKRLNQQSQSRQYIKRREATHNPRQHPQQHTLPLRIRTRVARLRIHVDRQRPHQHRQRRERRERGTHAPQMSFRRGREDEGPADAVERADGLAMAELSAMMGKRMCVGVSAVKGEAYIW
ncbi:hypothetical protein D9619_012594 [Psilocybe cf. subviscida]|uniref:Uncharacterized protein n=1 Tax=Psilocybe cf. subviscida TaxID=2480587 RepID=A0A8H5B6I8_9AGAR|nr:hypothetical protein D9619_012594 [Psilocybe cf. subviscida]